MAFRRLENKLKLELLNKPHGNQCYPKGTVHIIKSHKGFTPKERDELPFEVLLAYAELDKIRTIHIHFRGWEKYYKMRRRVGDQDVFGKISFQVGCSAT